MNVFTYEIIVLKYYFYLSINYFINNLLCFHLITFMDFEDFEDLDFNYNGDL